MLEIRILQAARLKGRLSAAAAAASSAVSEVEATVQIDRLRERGFLKGEALVRVTPEGRERLKELLDAEREIIDATELAAAYEAFDVHNTNLKTIIRDWQLIDGRPNDHGDAGYDGAVIERLRRLHESVAPLVDRVTMIVSRLLPYAVRLDHALVQIGAGDHSFVARPISDSYHTVWFEFHEELICLLGLSREAEAAAGRAV